MNNVALVGRFTKKPELKSGSNTDFVRFTLAVDREYKKDNGPDADFISCVAFSGTAKFIANYFNAGDPIGVIGSIQTGSYDDENGKKVYTTDVIVRHAEFTQNKSKSNDSAAQSEPQQDYTQDELPVGFSALGDDDMPF